MGYVSMEKNIPFFISLSVEFPVKNRKILIEEHKERSFDEFKVSLFRQFIQINQRTNIIKQS